MSWEIKSKGAKVLMEKFTQIKLLGTAPACGTPTYYCNCKACEEARSNPRARRTCSSMLVKREECTLIDCSPEMHFQLEREGIKKMHRILFTHEHFDHTGGIPQIEYLVRLVTKSPVEFFCNKQTAEYITSHYEDMPDCFNINVIEAYQRLEFDGISYTPILAKHNPGCFGYLIEIPSALNSKGKDLRIVYMPDTSRPCDKTLEIMHGVDLLVIDATFNGDNWMQSSHMSIDEAVSLANELEVRKVCLTHMSMHYDTPITLAELEARFGGSNVIVSYDGIELLG